VSQVAVSVQSQLGMMVQGCWQAAASVPVQGKHLERPDALAKEPGAQQLHTLLLLAPTTELARPAAHGVHAAAVAEPVAVLYVPSGQGVHAAWPIKGLNDPGAQRLHFDVPMMEWEPAGHTVNVSTVLKTEPPSTANASEIKPAAQANLTTLKL